MQGIRIKIHPAFRKGSHNLPKAFAILLFPVLQSGQTKLGHIKTRSADTAVQALPDNGYCLHRPDRIQLDIGNGTVQQSQILFTQRIKIQFDTFSLQVFDILGIEITPGFQSLYSSGIFGNFFFQLFFQVQHLGKRFMQFQKNLIRDNFLGQRFFLVLKVCYRIIDHIQTIILLFKVFILFRTNPLVKNVHYTGLA